MDFKLAGNTIDSKLLPQNAISPILSKPSGSMTDSKLLQPEKAFSLMVLRPSEKDMFVIPLHPLNAPLGIFVSRGIMIIVRTVQFSKAFLPKDVILPKSIEANDVHPLNALSPIFMTDPRLTLLSDIAPQKAFSHISEVLLGNTTLESNLELLRHPYPTLFPSSCREASDRPRCRDCGSTVLRYILR